MLSFKTIGSKRYSSQIFKKLINMVGLRRKTLNSGLVAAGEEISYATVAESQSLRQINPPAHPPQLNTLTAFQFST